MTMENIYAALMLHKLGKEIDENSVKKIVVAAGGNTDDSQVKSLIASLKGVNIDQELASASLFAAAPVSAKTETKVEAHKEEKKAPAAEGLSALFG